MAKSRLEPNKIVRYAESSIPKNGISTRPTPRVQKTVSVAKAEVQAAVEAPAPPAPTPPAPAPPAPEGETRSFLFDGATELTGSFSTVGGSRFNNATLGGTFTPGWAQEDTGSFTIFLVKDDRVSDGFNFSYFFERVSGSAGYVDYIGSQFSSGSGDGQVFMRTKRRLSVSPNFYSGSISSHYIQLKSSAGMSSILYENGNQQSTPILIDYVNAPAAADAAYAFLDSTNYSISVGGPASGSSYYTGSIDNLAVSKFQTYVATKTMPPKVEEESKVDFVYKFEGNTLATKGGSNLEVVGTETYISSSL